MRTINWKYWDINFYESDCSQTIFHFFGATNINSFILSAYICFVLACGYLYGRHKGLESSQFDGFIPPKNAQTKMIELASTIWFIASSLIFPCILCFIWIFYAIHFGDIHYINAYNPWIFPFVFAYFLYSATVILSYSHFNGFAHQSSYTLIRAAILCLAILTFFVLYVLMKNGGNKLNEFSFGALYGNAMVHCFDLSEHHNPFLLLLFVILYFYVTHHVFVALRASTAYFCNGQYVEMKTKKRKKMKKRSGVYRNDEESNDESDRFGDYFVRNRSESMNRNAANNNKGSKYENEPDKAPQAYLYV